MTSVVYNTENKRILTDTTGKNFVSIPTENTENKRILITYGGSKPPIEGLYLLNDGDGLYNILGPGSENITDLIPASTPIRGIVLGDDGEYYINEDEVEQPR